MKPVLPMPDADPLTTLPSFLDSKLPQLIKMIPSQD